MDFALSCHGHFNAVLESAYGYRRRTGQANCAEVANLNDAPFTLFGSPVVAIDRAQAVAEIQGAEVALQTMEQIRADQQLTEYQPFWAARAELLARIGTNDEASRSYEIAIGLERTVAVRRFLHRRRSALLA